MIMYSPVSSAAQASRRILWRSKIFLLAGLVGGVIALLGYETAEMPALIALALWLVFAGFTLFFFRDPSPRVPFGSRCDLYLPLAWNVTVKPGHKVQGGKTIVACRNHAPVL